MARWEIEYYSAGWHEVTATVDDVSEELNGHEEATFRIANTADNRSFVLTDQIIRFSFDGSQVFLGALLGVEYSLTQLKCIVYNGVYELLKRRVISGDYKNVPANVVAEAIRVAAGLINPLGSCPTMPITVSFDQTLCFDAIVMVADILNKDYWTQNGDTLYIGTRGSSQSFDDTVGKISLRGLDRSKKRVKFHLRGVDAEGNQIMGVAGSGDDVAVDWCHKATTLTTLNALAARKLAEVNTDDSGIPLTCPITSGIHLHPGDTISINRLELNLSGYYRIKKITKHRKTVEVEISRAKKATEDILEELMKDNAEALSTGVVDAFPFTCWEDLIAKFGFFPKKGIQWSDIWKYLPNINKSLIPASDNTYDIGDIITPLRWKAIFGVYEFPSFIGPYSDTQAMLQFWTKNKTGSAVVDHQFAPTDDEHGVLGAGEKKWKEVNSYSFFFPPTGYVRCRIPGENALMHLLSDRLEFGSGGGSAPDIYLKRSGDNAFELKAWVLAPLADNVCELGSETNRFKKIHVVDFTLYSNLLPGADDSYDIGQGGATPKRWRDLHLSGSLNIAGFTVITSARVLQNVTADTAIITSGQFPLARMPRDSAGLILEAQGESFNPMYVDPNGRYYPSGHEHAAGDITSGVLDEARCPNVYSNSITFNGGIVTSSVNCKNWQLADLTFLNKFIVTEAWFDEGLAFLDPDKRLIAFLDKQGNMEITGKVTEFSEKLRAINRGRGFD